MLAITKTFGSEKWPLSYLKLMFSCQERNQNFFRGRAPKFDIFERRFSGCVSLKQNEGSNGFRGSGGMLYRNICENLRSIMGILVLLEQVFRQIVFEFFALNFEVFTKYRYDAIFSHVFYFCVPV